MTALARLLMMSPSLVIPTEYEDFWESVIRYLIMNQPIPANEVSAIVWFIDQQRFRPAETVWGPGAGQVPLQPNFSLRCRSLMSLRRHMANWRTEFLAKLPPLIPSTPGWDGTDIQPFRYSQGERHWTIDELLTDNELRVEGGIMQHCVATYIHDCATSSHFDLVNEGGRGRASKTSIDDRGCSEDQNDLAGKRKAQFVADRHRTGDASELRRSGRTPVRRHGVDEPLQAPFRLPCHSPSVRMHLLIAFADLTARSSIRARFSTSTTMVLAHGQPSPRASNQLTHLNNEGKRRFAPAKQNGALLTITRTRPNMGVPYWWIVAQECATKASSIRVRHRRLESPNRARAVFFRGETLLAPNCTIRYVRR